MLGRKAHVMLSRAPTGIIYHLTLPEGKVSGSKYNVIAISCIVRFMYMPTLIMPTGKTTGYLDPISNKERSSSSKNRLVTFAGTPLPNIFQQTRQSRHTLTRLLYHSLIDTPIGRGIWRVPHALIYVTSTRIPLWRCGRRGIKFMVLLNVRLLFAKATEGVVGQIETAEKHDGCEKLVEEG
jgi:hypothetical protein